jgi:hypothetical protein
MIFLSEHAKERMKMRINCSEVKMKKVAEKAFASNEPILRGEIINSKFYEEFNGDKPFYRKFMGQIYVFCNLKNTNNVLLITVHRPGNCIRREKELEKKLKRISKRTRK